MKIFLDQFLRGEISKSITEEISEDIFARFPRIYGRISEGFSSVVLAKING